jgi:hypothetical protein
MERRWRKGWNDACRKGEEGLSRGASSEGLTGTGENARQMRWSNTENYRIR